jgi:hypothetical protein
VNKPDAVLRDQLIERARSLAKEREWVWRDPVEITASAHRGEPVWVLRTNVLMRGQNVRVVLRRSDHTIMDAGYLPR